MSKYSGFEGIASICFVIFVLSWTVLRLIYYPFWIIWSTRWLLHLAWTYIPILIESLLTSDLLWHEQQVYILMRNHKFVCVCGHTTYSDAWSRVKPIIFLSNLASFFHKEFEDHSFIFFSRRWLWVHFSFSRFFFFLRESPCVFSYRFQLYLLSVFCNVNLSPMNFRVVLLSSKNLSILH